MFGSLRRVCLALEIGDLQDLTRRMEGLFSEIPAPSAAAKLSALPDLCGFSRFAPETATAGACQEVVEGIEYFNDEKDVDVIILGRGGGSLEDLACFNEEAVARAIWASRIPVVSGVGHEIDFTIADFVADVRAPTPTAAADMVVRDKRELSDILGAMRDRLAGLMRNRLESSRLILSRDKSALKEKRAILMRQKMYLDELFNNLHNSFSALYADKSERLRSCTQRLTDLNPENILRRGYSITVRADTRAVVREANQVSAGEEVSVRLFRGALDCVVEKSNP
jgi:exodeoxyribonuclease VII large subunit